MSDLDIDAIRDRKRYFEALRIDGKFVNAAHVAYQIVMEDVPDLLGEVERLRHSNAKLTETIRAAQVLGGGA